ncbi:MAG: glycoside hydrolase family 32 protein [Anaerolineae bacterium]
MTKNKVQKSLPDDPYRPQYHFLPPANWMSDPNGLIQWNGQYHLFYQYNPYQPFHHCIHWGHAVSDDLVHWRHLPIALAPTPGGPDADGCYSGCAVSVDGIPRLFYTGVSPQVVCTATSSDGLLTWDKSSENPIIPGPPPSIDAGPGRDFRDPYVWKEHNRWYMVIGSRIQDVGGVVLLYSSADLVHWSYEGPLLEGNERVTTPFRLGTMWECPNFFEVGNLYALILSVAMDESYDPLDEAYFPRHLLHAVYFTGTYQQRRFSPIMQALVDHGGCFYAPQVMRDDSGRLLMWGWLREGRNKQAQLKAGWSGVMSLPRVISLGRKGSLRFTPAPELGVLRQEHRHWGDLLLSEGDTKDLEGVCGSSLELLAEIELDETSTVELVLGHPTESNELTKISYDAATHMLAVDTTKSSLDPEIHGTVRQATLPVGENGILQLHLFLDHSVLEVFANEEACFASRIYPTFPSVDGVYIVGLRGSSRIRSVDVWRMNSIHAE